MALKTEVLDVLNRQIEKEFDASVVYLGMYTYFEKELFKGFAAWFKKQTSEERTHAQKFIEYILDRGETPTIPATKSPRNSYKSVLDAMKGALAHEQANTAGIHECLKVAQQAGDPATAEMLQWFVKEQVEEEKWASEYVDMVEKIASSVGGLWMFDHRVGKKAE